VVFSSITFLFFFLPIVLGLYHLVFLPVSIGHRSAPFWRHLSNLFLLTVSLFFYFWGEGWLIWIILASTLIDYCCGLLIGGAFHKGEIERLIKDAPRTFRQRAGLIISICSNLAFLCFFKYFNFGVDSLNMALPASWQIHDAMRIALPLGISFYTFQSMSYTIDVYRGQVKATANLIDFACFVTLFPQLVAGPIVRYRDIAHQLVHRTISRSLFASGVSRFTIGLAKKVLLANTVAQAADGILALPSQQMTTALAWIFTLCYSLQIYFDFSGYSDMAIGLGRMFGFDLKENFNYPYISRSIRDFWRRWHISLSTWFRDYVFVPLSLNVNLRSHVYVVLLMTWALVGLWHGASWNFVLWGVYQAVLIGAFRFIQRSYRRLQASRRRNSPASSRRERSGTRPWQSHLLRMASVILTFHFVVVGLVLFRAESTADAWMILSRVVSDFAFSRSGALAVMSLAELAAVLLSIAFLNLIEVWQRDQTFVQFLGARPFFVRLVIYCTLIFGIGFLGVFDAKEFIYFQF
jgi:alginate O-acetyltransferase complex protein AlgI